MVFMILEGMYTDRVLEEQALASFQFVLSCGIF